MGRTKLSAEERKSQILAAARTLFAQKGYSDVSLDEIAAEVGVSRPRVIQLFGSKQSIYEAIVEAAYAAHPMDQDLADPISRKDDTAVFEGFARHILKHTEDREDRETLKILMYARLREDSFHRSHFHKKDTLMMSRLTDYVGERIRAGVFRDIDPRTLIYCYQAMVANLAIYKNVLGRMDFVTIDELSRECARIFLEGVRADSP
ncbi:MAG: TetR/AcrR family transcriptional regulator [Desulfomonilaceae bacterium]|nr:TetR/AcrR family transcriptional regulator [Desulfomonilaceae bacterium]